MTTPVLFNRASPTEATLHLYGLFGVDITGQMVTEALSDAKGVKKLTVYCDSAGGELFTGFAILAQLERFAQNAEVVFVVDGLCASAATIAAMGAGRIVMTPNSTWMVHEARGVGGGTAADHAKMAEILAQENGKLISLYVKKTRQTPSVIAEFLAAETYLDAAGALAAGFIDEILTEEKPKVKGKGKATVSASARVEDAGKSLRLAAMQAEALRIRQLSNAASRAGIPGQPGPRSETEQDRKEEAKP